MKTKKTEKKEKVWALAPEFRTTLNQKIGGEISDFVQAHVFLTSKGRHKKMLTFICEETGMEYPLLRSFFHGEKDLKSEYDCIMCAIQDLSRPDEYRALVGRLEKIEEDYFSEHGDEFLEEERIARRPKKKENQCTSGRQKRSRR